MLVLYYTPESSSFATHIALNEVGADFEARRVSLADQEHKSDAYL